MEISKEKDKPMKVEEPPIDNNNHVNKKIQSKSSSKLWRLSVNPLMFYILHRVYYESIKTKTKLFIF